MAPEPFNSMEELLRFTSFRLGSGNSSETMEALRASAEQATFEVEALQDCLQRARDEIWVLTNGMSNEEFEEPRQRQLKTAELWLCLGELYPLYGERLNITVRDSNSSGIGEWNVGPDTPSPAERQAHWERMGKLMRERAMELIESKATRFVVSVSRLRPRYAQRFSCLTCGDYPKWM
jgi:hypothetical protein